MRPSRWLDLRRFHGRVQVMQGHQPLLHVGPGASFWVEPSSTRTEAGADPVEQRFLLRVGVGLADRGDLLGGMPRATSLQVTSS